MNKRILRLAIPNIISNISVPLLGMVDIAIVGHLESAAYIGAIAIGSMIFSFIYWGLGFLRMGTSGMTAQAYGARNLKESILVFSRAILVAITLGLILIILQIPIANFSFFLIEGSSEVEMYAREYFLIRIWAAPASIGLYAFTGWFIGMQNAKTPMYITIFINLINVGFSFWFVYGMGMKADGVALGTVCAQYIGLILSLGIFLLYYKKLNKYFSWKDTFDLIAIKRFFSLNRDIFIRTFCLIIALSFFTVKSAAINDEILAINTLLFQFFLLFSYFIDGFAHASEALVGKYIGAKNKTQLKILIKRLFFWGGIVSIPFTLIYLLAGKNILLLLTNNKEIIEMSSSYLIWIILIPILSYPAFLYDGIFIGATAGKAMRNAMLISTFAIFLPLYYLLKEPMGNHGLWLAFLIFLVTRGISLGILSKNSIFNRV
jgi:MATE family, multidrug efflux pump